MSDSSKTIDLAAEFNKYAHSRLGSAASSVVKFEVDIGALAVALATAWAEDMRDNMLAGKHPDGSKAMPTGKTTGKPRGEATGTVASISLRWSQSDNRMVIAADEDTPGTLKRILRGVAFRPPATSPRIEAVKGNAAVIATLTAAVRNRETKTWSKGRLEKWRTWQAKKKEIDAQRKAPK